MFLTVAVLMMVLGLVVNLANQQRTDSLDRRTRGQLQRLTAAVARYAADHGGQPPEVTPLVDPAVAASATEPALQAAARRNRDDVRRALRWPAPPSPDVDPLSDPWGTPIVLMPRQSPIIGMAPGDRFFFVSAGPDRQFLTRADNRYSYDYADDAPTSAPAPATAPATGPAAGGQRE